MRKTSKLEQIKRKLTENIENLVQNTFNRLIVENFEKNCHKTNFEENFPLLIKFKNFQ